MKRITRIVIICSFLLTSIGVVPGLAAPDPPLPGNPVFLPLMNRGSGALTVSGTIKDVDQYPVQSVTITDKNGATAVTDSNGAYTLRVQPGANTLTASRSGFVFTPAQVDVNVITSVTGVDFAADITCGDIIVNGTLDFGMGGWDFPDVGTATGGTDPTLFHTGPRSGRTGLPATATNVASFSSAESQVYHLPSKTDFAVLGLWVYQTSTVISGGDAQMIQILDTDGDVLDTLFTQNANTAAWTFLEFSLDAFIGDAIVIRIATLNDGLNGQSAMYFDDVTLTTCDEGTSCVLTENGGFEGSGGWFFLGPQLVPPQYSSNPVHAGLFSMQTGIAITGTNQVSFSEIFQDVHIPSSAPRASLDFWIFTTSGVTAAELKAAGPLNLDLTSTDRTAIPQIDQQYAYVLDSDGNVNKILFKMFASNTNAWVHYSFDLDTFIGDDIQLLFGTYNDGLGGATAMWIDDVVLKTCK